MAEMIDMASYGVASMMEASGDNENVAEISEEDVDMMIEDARNSVLKKEDVSPQESSLKRSKTIKKIEKVREKACFRETELFFIRKDLFLQAFMSSKVRTRLFSVSVL